MEKVRHQLFLPKPLSDRLEALATKPGASKSAILVDAVTAWLNRRGASELEERFAIRFDRLTQAIGLVDRDTCVVLETLALFIRLELAIQTSLAENDQAGRALGAKRIEAFVTQVGQQVSTGRRSLGPAPAANAEDGE